MQKISILFATLGLALAIGCSGAGMDSVPQVHITVATGGSASNTTTAMTTGGKKSTSTFKGCIEGEMCYPNGAPTGGKSSVATDICWGENMNLPQCQTGGASSTGVAGGSSIDVKPSTGGTGFTQDPPPTGGAMSTGGSSATGTGGGSSQDVALTGGKSGVGGGSTQDPPPATGGCPSNATGGSPGTGGTTDCGCPGIGGGSSQDVATGGKMATGGSPATGGAATGGKPATGGSPSTGGMASTGGAMATGGTTSTEKCQPVEYKFYVTASKKTIKSATITCTDIETGETIPPVTCDDPTCCYYTIPNDCHAWACQEITSATCDPNDSTKPCMPRAPSYDASTQSCFFDWGTYAIITNFEGNDTHYWLEEGTDYLLVPDTTTQTCVLVHPPHDGEHYYKQ